MNGIIYKATNKLNGSCYIGRTVKDIEIRKQEHRNLSISGKRNYYFYNAIRKYGWDNFDWCILFKSSEITPDELDNLEKQYILFYKNSGINLYNKTDGGKGMLGLKFSDEHRRKIALSNKGKKISDKTRQLWSLQRKGRALSGETKHKLSEALKGRKLSDEHKQKISKLHKGKRLSEEHKRKLSLAKKGRKLSQEHINKIKMNASKFWLGKHHSEETRKKISESLKKYREVA